MADWLRHKLPERVDVAGFLQDGRFVYDDGRPVRTDDPYLPHTFVWFHRDLREEVEVPGSLDIVHRDDRIIVVDKPPFLSTIPAASTCSRASWSGCATSSTCPSSRRCTGWTG